MANAITWFESPAVDFERATAFYSTIFNVDMRREAFIVQRVESAGGRVLVPVTSIGDPGRIAIIIDTEGNRVGLHSPGQTETL